LRVVVASARALFSSVAVSVAVVAISVAVRIASAMGLSATVAALVAIAASRRDASLADSPTGISAPISSCVATTTAGSPTFANQAAARFASAILLFRVVGVALVVALGVFVAGRTIGVVDVLGTVAIL
jgi:hypothetical protein